MRCSAVGCHCRVHPESARGAACHRRAAVSARPQGRLVRLGRERPTKRTCTRHSSRGSASWAMWRGRTSSWQRRDAEGQLDQLPALAVELVRAPG